MVAGFWTNYDGLPLQFGTQKAIPELGGDYLLYGETREFETLISLATTSFSANNILVPGVPSSFSGTSTPIAAGIQSMTSLFPLQMSTPVTAGAASGGGLTISAPQIWIDKVELECLVTANAGSGGATAVTIGLVTMQPGTSTTSGQFQQVTTAGNAYWLSGVANAAMTQGAVYTYRSGNTAGTGGGGTIAYSTANSATLTGPTSWLGWMPVPTNSFMSSLVNSTPTNTANAWISTIATGGTYSGNNAAGLLKLRINYTLFGNINQ